MVRYYITDGKDRYIRRSKGRYTICSSPVMADVFPYREALSIIDNSLKKTMRGEFHPEEVVTGEKVDRSNTEEIADSSDILNQFSMKEDAVEGLRWLADAVCSLKMPTLQELQSVVAGLEQAQSYYDMAMSDVAHWIKDNSPPPDVRAEVYGMCQDIMQKRAAAKESLRMVRVFLEARTKDYPLQSLQVKLAQCADKPYRPDTHVYKDLDSLLAAGCQGDGAADGAGVAAAHGEEDPAA